MDKVIFENFPGTNTPMTAERLNQMQSNIEKSAVALGSTQPSTNEKVWLKKGKNLFNKNLGFINAYINVNAKIIADRYNALFNQHIPVKAGETYTVKANQNVFNMYMNFFEADGTFISYQGSETTTQQITVTAPQNAEYALLQFNYDGSATVTSTIIDSLDLMIVQGQTAGTYETYVEKEILVKNDNGVFEKLYKEGNGVIEKVTNENGTAIKYDDGTMVCYGTIAKTIDINQSYEGVYFGASSSIFYPISFNSVPVINVSVSQSESLISINIAGNTTERFSTYIWKNQSKTNVEINIHYIAIGRWC